MMIHFAWRLQMSQHLATRAFPFPAYRHACEDTPDAVLKMLQEVHRTFDQGLVATRPPENINALAPLGYTAFRWATEIDPVWNLYFLALVLFVAPTIEAKRLPRGVNAVFSYRFEPDPATGHLYADSTWRHYKQNALDKFPTIPLRTTEQTSPIFILALRTIDSRMS